jgi:hypothetical protein
VSFHFGGPLYSSPGPGSNSMRNSQVLRIHFAIHLANAILPVKFDLTSCDSFCESSCVLRSSWSNCIRKTQQSSQDEGNLYHRGDGGTDLRSRSILDRILRNFFLIHSIMFYHSMNFFRIFLDEKICFLIFFCKHHIFSNFSCKNRYRLHNSRMAGPIELRSKNEKMLYSRGTFTNLNVENLFTMKRVIVETIT